MAFAVLFSAIIAFDVFVVGGQFQYYYQTSLADKEARLNSINEPKIILVGNSNLAFGIDSKMIEDAIGMPVVNMGLHGGIGNAFNEEIAKHNINEGDIVVVCHNTYTDENTIDDREAAWIAIDNDINLLKVIRPKDYLRMAEAYPNYLQNSLFMWVTRSGNEPQDSSYSRSAFNEYGDIAYRPESEQVDLDTYFNQYFTLPYVDPACTDRLNELKKYVEDRGASIVIAGYPIAYGEYSQYDRQFFVDFKEELDAACDIEIISDYTDYMYPYEYFYNSYLHMTEEGAKARTKQLITDLENWLNNK